MKHFEIHYLIGHSCFEYKCTTAREAFDAMRDLANHDGRLGSAIDLDKVMIAIVDVMRGDKTSYHLGSARLTYRDGEV